MTAAVHEANKALCAVPPRETASRPRSALAVVAPLTAGFFLSYLFRNVNAAIAPDLVRDLKIDAAALGFLTSSFFLAFAAAQLPIGVALDRFGPRRVQTVLLSVAAAGLFFFSLADVMSALVSARLLIGIGTAGCMMAALKAAALWYPRERLSVVVGGVMMCGALGTVAATTPLVMFVGYTGWRSAFLIFAGAAFLLAIITWLVVPDPPKATQVSGGAFKDVARHRWFWLFAPLSALCFGAFSALQGLWAGRWLTEVERLDPQSASFRLLLMACAFVASGPMFGAISRSLSGKVGGPTQAVAAASCLVTLELLIASGAPIPGVVPWTLLGLFGAIHVITYGVLAKAFPISLIGRANSMLNLCHITTAFTLQSLFGAGVSRWPLVDGRYPAEAYRSALIAVIVLQVTAILTFVISRTRVPQR